MAFLFLGGAHILHSFVHIEARGWLTYLLLGEGGGGSEGEKERSEVVIMVEMDRRELG